MEHHWNDTRINRDNWKKILELSADDIEFVRSYIKTRFGEAQTPKEAARTAASNAYKVGGKKTAAAYLNRPEIIKAIDYHAEILSEDVIKEFRTLYITAQGNRAFFRYEDYFTERGELREGLKIEDLPPFILDSITRKPRPGSAGSNPEKDIFEMKIADRKEALNQIGKIIGIVNDEKVSVTVNNLTATPAKKRKALQDFKKRIERVKNSEG